MLTGGIMPQKCNCKICQKNHAQYVNELSEQGKDYQEIKRLLLSEKLLNVTTKTIENHFKKPSITVDTTDIVEYDYQPIEKVSTDNIDELISKYGIDVNQPQEIISHIQKTHLLMYLKQQEITFRELNKEIAGDQLNNSTKAIRNLKSLSDLLDNFTHISMWANTASAIAHLQKLGYQINVSSSTYPQTIREDIAAIEPSQIDS
ncbi:hypothetical protein [Trichormus variabilis]|uniref:Uncharacterized protein n=1 Tax=Trichormus variabilis NIES-23 TaxID=1973479 RepID=A0A1Z4KX70_ANAVA|nr:hypothetical protein [Trichormus variabilis]BAY73586.1 hypothetical protein NIES23_64380 [Trichormus variabilis NIES-23]